MKQKINKKLTLSRETVRELTDSQLGWAVGGSDGTIDACPLTRLQGCGNSNSNPTCLCQHTHTCQPC